MYPVIDEPPSDGLLHDKSILVSEITLVERLGEEGVVTDEGAEGATESSVGVADAVFDRGLPPMENSAFTTYV